MSFRDTVSIIIPVYNEEKYINKCLDSILNQSYQNIVEILVLDGMSMDSTRELIKKYTDERIVLIDNPKKIQSAALNKGIQLSKGDIVVRVDAHADYDYQYVENCVIYLNKLKDENVVNVGGPTYLVESGDYIEDSIIYLHESKFGIGVAKFRQVGYEGFVDTVWNGAFWRWLFDEIGLYNEELTRSEDNDMNNRITSKGYKIYQSKNIIARYKPRNSISKVLKQNMDNGKAIGNALVNNREIIRIRHLVPVAFLLWIVIFGLLSLWSNIGLFLEMAALICYFAVDLIESLRIGMKKGMKFIPIMFIMFFSLHISYGLGTIIGSIKRN